MCYLNIQLFILAGVYRRDKTLKQFYQLSGQENYSSASVIYCTKPSNLSKVRGQLPEPGVDKRSQVTV